MNTTRRVETVMCGNDLHEDDDIIAYVVRDDERIYSIHLNHDEARAALGDDFDDDRRFLCDRCGRVGTTDDGISDDGDDCPDEECGGTVHVYVTP